MFRLSALLVELCLTAMAGGCGGQAKGGPANLVPELCHSEYRVGLFFVTIVNRGNNAGPSTMTLAYRTTSSTMSRVQLQVKTPGIPAGNEIWLAVELPPMPGLGGFVLPAGKISITADATHVLPEMNRADQVLVTSCKDGR